MAVTFTSVQGYDAARKQTNVTCAAADTITLDMLQQGNLVFIQMPAGNVTVANPLNPEAGQELYLEVKQDGVGSRTITWGAAFKKNVTLSVGANALDFVSFVYDGTNWVQTGSALNLS